MCVDVEKDQRVTAVLSLFSFLFVVAQALGYMRNGIIKISFALDLFILLVEKG